MRTPHTDLESVSQSSIILLGGGQFRHDLSCVCRHFLDPLCFRCAVLFCSSSKKVMKVVRQARDGTRVSIDAVC